MYKDKDDNDDNHNDRDFNETLFIVILGVSLGTVTLIVVLLICLYVQKRRQIMYAEYESLNYESKKATAGEANTENPNTLVDKQD
jgi:hypothetical protein